MGIHLRRELLSYGTALLMLQGLESRHHLMSLKVGRGKAASVPSVSAEIRGMQNRDLRDSVFQSMLPDLIVGIGSMTTLPWSNRDQLIQNITKQVYRGLHDDPSQQAAYFARFRKHLQRVQSREAAKQRNRDQLTMISWSRMSARRYKAQMPFCHPPGDIKRQHATRCLSGVVHERGTADAPATGSTYGER